MRCERLSKWFLLFAFVAACAREQPAPPPPVTTHEQTQTAATTSSVAPPVLSLTAGSYDEGILWLESAPAFRFVLEEGGVKTEGSMTRKTIGAEVVEFTANGETWRAQSGPDGVTWQKRVGGGWKPLRGPDYGNRVYQRVTLAFDPAKKEGTAQLVALEGTSNHYRFTDANLGLVHDVWVNTADNHVERIRIGDAMEMTIQP
jgi:hypothetical protein